MNSRSAVEQFLSQRLEDPAFSEYLADMIVDLCTIDTTPIGDMDELRRREERAFDLIRATVEKSSVKCDIEAHPIDEEAMKCSPSYTPPYYTAEKRPYRNRSNLVVTTKATRTTHSGAAVAVNAHVDTVHPHIPPKRGIGRVFGRGACDDKGNVVVMLAALELLGEIEASLGVAPAREITYMFVIDEESGGNGSLALALDRRLKTRYEELVVLECCDNIVYPANRGALWYKIDLPLARIKRPLEVAAQLVLALERMGKAIKAESDHPLFPERPVQTCHGIWGPWGQHPSRVCGYVELTLTTALSEPALRERIDAAVRVYTSAYGDKTSVIRDGAPVVPWHYELERRDLGFLLKVMGSTGHMGAVEQNDGALTKASFVIDELTRDETEIEIGLVGLDDSSVLVIEGGQSFLPTHTLDQIKVRISEACTPVLTAAGVEADGIAAVVTTDKLHNAAFCSDPDSRLYKGAAAIAASFGLSQPESPRGWHASCDARVFAAEYPAMNIITMGAGNLTTAHADNESVGIEEVARNAVALAALLLERTGTFALG